MKYFRKREDPIRITIIGFSKLEASIKTMEKKIIIIILIGYEMHYFLISKYRKLIEGIELMEKEI